jgi:hypothetical protein
MGKGSGLRGFGNKRCERTHTFGQRRLDVEVRSYLPRAILLPA